MRKTSKFVKVIALTLMMAILISVAMPIVASASNPFTDVQPGAWHHDYVTWANTNGITGGTTATTFSPANNVTRAQFVTFLWRMNGSPNVTATHNFTDVATGTWFTTAVAWAHAEGVSGGTSPTTFAPHDDVTRQQIATMLFNFLPSPANAPTDAVDRFTDSGRIAPWAQYGMRWAAHREIMGRGLDTLTPGDVASRAHTVAMLYRVARTYSLTVGTTPAPAPSPSPAPPAGSARVLQDGTHIVGQAIPAGRYTVTAVVPADGTRNTGNLAVWGTLPFPGRDGALVINDILNSQWGRQRPNGTFDFHGTASVTVTLTDGDRIEINNQGGRGAGFSFGPVVTPAANTLTSGRWIVGQDIAPGRVTVTPNPAGHSGIFRVINADGRNAHSGILGGTSANAAASVTVTLENGQHLYLSQLNATFSR